MEKLLHLTIENKLEKTVKYYVLIKQIMIYKNTIDGKTVLNLACENKN